MSRSVVCVLVGHDWTPVEGKNEPGQRMVCVRCRQLQKPTGAMSVYASAAFLMTVGAAAIVIGLHDVWVAPGFGASAGSAVLFAVGVILCLAARRLARLGSSESLARGIGSPIVLAAFLLTMLIGLYVLAAARTATAQRPLVICTALALIGGALLGLRTFARGAKITLPEAGAAVAVGLIGTGIGAWQFWYQNRYVPSHAERAVALKVELHRDAQQVGADDVIRATVGYQDIGGKSVSVLGSAYTLTGSRVVRCHRPATTKRIGEVFSGLLPDPQRTRYMADVFEQRPATVLAAGKFVGDGSRLDANVPAGRDLVFHVPRHRYQLLRFRAQLFAIPASVQLSQRTLPQPMRFPGDNQLYWFWRIDDDSWLHDLLYGRARWIVLRYELVDPGNAKAIAPTPDLRVTARFPKATWKEQRPSRLSVQRLFADIQFASDASEPFADTEMALEDVPRPGARDLAHLPKCSAGD